MIMAHRKKQDSTPACTDKCALRLIAFLLTVFLPLLLTTPGFCVKKSTTSVNDHADTRSLHFPAKSIGALSVVKAHRPDDSWFAYGFDEGQQIRGAQGTVSLTIPPGYSLLVDANRRVFENPSLLDEVSPDGIDVLRLSFTSMDDSEDGMLEQALKHVHKLTGLRALYLDRSEVTDMQLTKLKPLPHLGCINFFLSWINGSCFEYLKAFPELYEIDAPCCQIEQSNIKSLVVIRKLKNLDLRRSNITLEGARAIQKITGLVKLDLADNPKFNDDCVKLLCPLVHLKQLDLRNTEVTIAGVKSMASLKLESLALPARLQPRLKELKLLFPNTKISFAGSQNSPLTRTDKMMFGPLH
jgi:hypothetical protein